MLTKKAETTMMSAMMTACEIVFVEREDVFIELPLESLSSWTVLATEDEDANDLLSGLSLYIFLLKCCEGMGRED